MSQWTHIVGNIRVDGFSRKELSKIKEIMDKPITFQDLIKPGYDPVTSLPMGSEGSLQHKILEYREPGLPWITIPIWGDLRDYDNVDELHKWFENTCKKLVLIRDAVMYVQVEFQCNYIFIYDVDTESVKKITINL